MGRSYSAVIAAVLLLLSVCSMVPSLIIGAQPVFHEDTPGPTSTTDDGTGNRDVTLDMMHFSPSASVENGVYYVARRGVDTIAYFGASEVYYLVRGSLLRLGFPGSNLVSPVGEEPVGSVTNYFVGNDPAKWRTGLLDCAVLRYCGIYPGIDLVYRIQNAGLKYEFVVAPYADPEPIRLRYSNADRVDVSKTQVIVVSSDYELVDTGLTVFQDDGMHRDVECSFSLDASHDLRFLLGMYDQSSRLVIDPVVLLYSTFLGGSDEDQGYDIVVSEGSVYVTGSAWAGFPTVNAYDSTHNGNRDCFVTKFAADGQSLVYSTYLGGTSDDYGTSIDVESGYAYVTGYTKSSGFPTANAYNATFGGDEDCFVTKIAVDGESLVYSTFIGRAGMERGQSIAVENGNPYITGLTASSNFPTANAFDSTFNGASDCFVIKLATDGQALTYSTFLGGTAGDYGYGIAVDGGSAYVTGYTYSTGFPTANPYDSTHNGGTQDCFVTKLATNGMSLIYSTFLGGNGYDRGLGIAVESGHAYISGLTTSSDFPTVNAYFLTYGGSYDCFVTEFAIDGQSLVYSTYLGGADLDESTGIAVDLGHVYVTGRTVSVDFPTVNAYDSTYNGGYDIFVTSFASEGQWLVYSTRFGSKNALIAANGIAVVNGSAYITGWTEVSDFPTVNAYDSTYNGVDDCFVSIFSNTDSDSDGLSDWEEDCLHGTDPFRIDSDYDNFLDGYEVAYGSDPLDPLSYPGMPQSWYDAIYEDLDGNATLIRQVISWLDGNHTAIETLLYYLQGNATLLIQTVNALNSNSSQLDLLAALVTHDVEALSTFNVTYIDDMAEIRAVLDMLGVTVGDTDYDGLDDLDEIAHGTDIQCIDTDCDNLNDAYEVKIGTDPTDDDSDNDTYFDGAEVLAGTDPLDALDYPGHSDTTTVPPMGIELIVIMGAAGCVGLMALLVLMRRRTGTRAPS